MLLLSERILGMSGFGVRWRVIKEKDKCKYETGRAAEERYKQCNCHGDL